MSLVETAAPSSIAAQTLIAPRCPAITNTRRLLILDALQLTLSSTQLIGSNLIIDTALDFSANLQTPALRATALVTRFQVSKTNTSRLGPIHHATRTTVVRSLYNSDLRLLSVSRSAQK
jgi:hypothetical protein